MTDFNLDVWAAKLAGVAGALVSMRYIQGSPTAKAGMFISGSLVSYYASPFLTDKVGMPLQLSGFLLGMFGMTIISRVWEWIQAAPIGELWQAAVDRVRGRRE
jgi:hypothetical protein